MGKKLFFLGLITLLSSISMPLEAWCYNHHQNILYIEVFRYKLARMDLEENSYSIRGFFSANRCNFWTDKHIYGRMYGQINLYRGHRFAPYKVCVDFDHIVKQKNGFQRRLRAALTAITDGRPEQSLKASDQNISGECTDRCSGRREKKITSEDANCA